jgi:hypothetical protein
MSQLIYIQHDQVQIHEHYMFYFDIPNQHKLEPRNQYPTIFCMNLLSENQDKLELVNVLANLQYYLIQQDLV